MNNLDYLFLGVIIVSSLIAYYRGLIKTIYSFFSLIISLIIGYILYPKINIILLEYTNVYKKLSLKIVESLDLKSKATGITSPQDQIDMIKSLRLPGFIKTNLIENNNKEVYKILKVTDIEEYIGGSIASLALSAIAFILVIIITSLIIKIITLSLDIISKLPILKQINRLGGLLLGIIQGLILIWIICIGISIYISIKPNDKLIDLIEGSLIIKTLYDGKILLNILANIRNK